MTRAELLNLVGKKVKIYFKDREKSIYGTLGYVDEFSEKYEFRKPGYFFIGNMSFKVSHIKKVEIYSLGGEEQWIIGKDNTTKTAMPRS